MQAQAEAFRFLNDHLPDRIIAGSPCLDTEANLWRIPVVLSYPHLGILGEVGEITVSTTTEDILSHTPIEKMRASALALAERYRETIEAHIP